MRGEGQAGAQEREFETKASSCEVLRGKMHQKSGVGRAGKVWLGCGQ